MANKIRNNTFITDIEKIEDMLLLSKEDFLKSYSYLSEEEYENTKAIIIKYLKSRKKYNEKQINKRAENVEQSRKKYLDYYYKNREKINKRRNELNRERAKERKAQKISKAKEYQIIKYNNEYGVTTKMAIEDYHKTGFLPYDIMMKNKKDLIEHINKIEKYKNNTDIETYNIN